MGGSDIVLNTVPVLFDSVAQAGWGQVVAKDLEHVWQLEFGYASFPYGSNTENPSSFNVGLDDLEFWNWASLPLAA